MTTLATRRGYRGKSKRSLCRKKTVRKCRKVKGCKNTKKTAKQSRYCRKRHNKRLVGGTAGAAQQCMKDCCGPCFGKIPPGKKPRGVCIDECSKHLKGGKSTP